MAQCYGYRSRTESVIQLKSSFSVPCPVGSGCCTPGDICLGYNICKFTHTPKSTGAYSGFYVSACVDPLFQNAACSTHCTDQPTPDIVYSVDSGLWACCGSSSAGNVTCNTPTNEVFSAPAPDALQTLSTGATISTSTRSSSSSSSSSTVVSSPTTAPDATIASSSSQASNAATTSSAAPTSITDKSSGFSTGAKAGTGIGIGLGVLLIAAAVMSCVLRGRRRRTQASTPATTEKYGTHRNELPGTDHAYNHAQEKDSRSIGASYEMSGTPRPPRELEAHQ